MDKMPSILVIEDEELIRTVLKRKLRRYRYQVYLAEDGPTGLEIARREKPTFILLDWMMPGMDGLDVLVELKADKKTKDIPVFMLTSRKMIGDLDEAFEVGVDGYIVKPLDLMELGEIIKAKWDNYKYKIGANSTD